MSGIVRHGDALLTLRDMPADSFHGSLCDPPYGLSFMGHGWDHGVPSAEVWREVMRVLRPGAHLLAFGGTRTYHRLTCAVEDAGFEIRDCMMWLYGSGFPKSHDVSKAIDKANGDHRGKAGKVISTNGAMGGPNYVRTPKGDPIAAAAVQYAGQGTALKPAWEPIIVARKPLDGTVAQNVQRWGCGGLAIDACRVPGIAEKPGGKIRAVRHFDGSEVGVAGMDAPEPNPLGRWPANVILDEEAGAALDEQSGELSSGSRAAGVRKGLGFHGANGDGGPCIVGNSGGASRFYYTAKASRSERDAGLDDFELVNAQKMNPGGIAARREAAGLGLGRNVHPTVKPLALARYLARLILPPTPDARMVVPFCGSGSEMIGALQAGWTHVEGIDSWDVAVNIARARLAHHEGIFGRVA